MRNKFLLIIIFSFLSLSLQAENVPYNYDNYLISEIQYKKNNKTYDTYRFFRTKQQMLSENFDTLYLMIASPSTQSAASLSGHSFVVLSKGKDLTNSTAISFSSKHETINIFKKILMITTSGIPGYIAIEPFSQIMERYIIGQNRTIFYYKMDINKEGINLLIDRLYELTEEKLKFQFFTNNCTNFSLKLFENTFDKNLNNETPVVIIPNYLPVILIRNNLVLESGTFTPPIARLNNETLNISKELIIKKRDYYNANLHETTATNKSEIFLPQKDLYDYGTKLDSYMSQVSLGIKNNNPTLGLSFFSSRRYEQRQSPTQAFQINFLEMNLIYNEKVKLDSINIFEYNTYPKINYGFDFTKIFKLMGERNLNDKFQPLVRGGFGISLGNSNILFNLTSDLDIPLSHIGMQLSLNSELILYNKIGYILIKSNLPYYQMNLDKELSLKSKAGVSLFDRLNIEGSYNWLDKNFEASIIWNFNPFYFG